MEEEHAGGEIFLEKVKNRVDFYPSSPYNTKLHPLLRGAQAAF
ncbi:hypothetical protein [Allofournierella sp.]